MQRIVTTSTTATTTSRYFLTRTAAVGRGVGGPKTTIRTVAYLPGSSLFSPSSSILNGTPYNNTNTTTTSRQFSSYVLEGWGGGRGGGGGGGSSWAWPVTKPNTIFNIVPQGYKYVVERFGKLHSVEDSGWFLAIPFVDQIAYVIDVRERAMDIPPQSAITRDNVSVEVSGNLFVKFQDPVAAAYGALNPLYSVTQVRTTKKERRTVMCLIFCTTYSHRTFLVPFFFLSLSSFSPPCDIKACTIGDEISNW
jgi:hypothetical protein